MKKIIFALPLLIILIIIVAFITLKDTSQKEMAPIQECQTIAFNGNDKINIVFFSSEEEAKKYSSELLNTPPFDKNKNQFNIFQINYQSKCEIYKNSAVLCYNKDLIKQSAVCPNDFIVVIKDEQKKIRSSAYMNVISLNSQNSMNVITHEFGHVFANLADEYIPSQLPKESQNCKKECSEFEKKDGCFQGCAKANLYRSIDWGLMRTLSTNNFGEFNKKIINNEIEKQTAITGMVSQKIEDCLKEQYYLIHAEYIEGQIKLIAKTIEQGCVGTNGNGGFDYNLILKDNSIINHGKFNPELIFTDAQEESENEIQGEATEYSGEFFLKIPIINDAEKLEILKEQEKITEINLKDINSRPCEK